MTIDRIKGSGEKIIPEWLTQVRERRNELMKEKGLSARLADQIATEEVLKKYN